MASKVASPKKQSVAGAQVQENLDLLEAEMKSRLEKLEEHFSILEGQVAPIYESMQDWVSAGALDVRTGEISAQETAARSLLRAEVNEDLRKAVNKLEKSGGDLSQKLAECAAKVISVDEGFKELGVRMDGIPGNTNAQIQRVTFGLWQRVEDLAPRIEVLENGRATDAEKTAAVAEGMEASAKAASAAAVEANAAAAAAAASVEAAASAAATATAPTAAAEPKEATASPKSESGIGPSASASNGKKVREKGRSSPESDGDEEDPWHGEGEEDDPWGSSRKHDDDGDDDDGDGPNGGGGSGGGGPPGISTGQSHKGAGKGKGMGSERQNLYDQKQLKDKLQRYTNKQVGDLGEREFKSYSFDLRTVSESLPQFAEFLAWLSVEPKEVEVESLRTKQKEMNKKLKALGSSDRWDVAWFNQQLYGLRRESCCGRAKQAVMTLEKKKGRAALKSFRDSRASISMAVALVLRPLDNGSSSRLEPPWRPSRTGCWSGTMTAIGMWSSRNSRSESWRLSTCWISCQMRPRLGTSSLNTTSRTSPRSARSSRRSLRTRRQAGTRRRSTQSR